MFAAGAVLVATCDAGTAVAVSAQTAAPARQRWNVVVIDPAIAAIQLNATTGPRAVDTVSASTACYTQVAEGSLRKGAYCTGYYGQHGGSGDIIGLDGCYAYCASDDECVAFYYDGNPASADNSPGYGHCGKCRAGYDVAYAGNGAYHLHQLDSRSCKDQQPTTTGLAASSAGNGNDGNGGHGDATDTVPSGSNAGCTAVGHSSEDCGRMDCGTSEASLKKYFAYIDANPVRAVRRFINVTPMGGRFGSVWLSARTMHPHGGAVYAW